ncbi:MAG: glycosyltransferase family 4 protein [Planctomycetes bacterium]|nr:glycosyltransferase family 4 protein [Planctomycetota bacterium]MCB9936268.1 glycosyltransferase family 4 protein [Planctomycetota bacterium]
MHIAFITEHFHKDPGGPRKAALAMAAALAELDHETSLLGIAPSDRDETLPGGGSARLRRYPWRLLPTRYGRPRFYSRELARLHAQRPIDAVLAMGLESAAAALRFRAESGVPFVLNPRSFLVNAPGTWKFERARMLLRECDAFVALSESAADAWCSALDYARDGKVFGVLNGVDAAELTGPVEPPSGLSGESLILCMAMLREPKGQHLLLKALARLTDLPWQLVLAGEGPARAGLHALTQRLGLDGRVLFTGMVRGTLWRWLYRHAQLFALTPVYMEACGNALLEAQAAGLPIVTTDAGSVPEVVSAESALIVPVGPVPYPDEAPVLPRLEAALRRALTDAGLRERMAAAGRERAAGLSWQRCVEGYLPALRGTGVLIAAVHRCQKS